VKTLADSDTQTFLGDTFVLAFHNQLPELYCNTSVDPGVDRFPGDQVDRCPESAGGGNLRLFLCASSGEVVFVILGYWSPPRFRDELARGLAVWKSRSDRAEAARLHLACRGEHDRSPDRAGKLLLRAHDEALADWGRPVRDVLDRIEDEIYLKGNIG
jgi:hypothetical protein